MRPNVNKREFMNAMQALIASGRVDYAQPQPFAHALARFGGADLLKKHFPKIIKKLHDTPGSAAARLQMEPAGTAGSSAHGRQDWFDLEVLKDDPRQDRKIRTEAAGAKLETLYAHSTAKYLEKKPFVMMRSELIEKASGKFLGGCAPYASNANGIVGTIVADPTVLITCEKRDIKAGTSFQAVQKDDKGNDVVTEVIRQENVFMLPGTNEAVESVFVEKPQEKSGAGTIKIVYNQRSDSNAAYTYPGAKAYKINGIDYVDVMLPLKGSVTFTKDFVVDSACLDDTFMCSLTSTLLTGGVQLNTAKWHEIVTTKTGQTLFWTFPENWGCSMELRDYKPDSIFDLYLRLFVGVRPAGLSTVFQVPFVVTSENIMESSAYKKIKQLAIQWGCLGRRSMVVMADGKEKAIEDIAVGDRVMCRDGGSTPVAQVIMGMEETMILARGEGKQPLLLSDAHPIATQRGLIMANMLNAADRLLAKDGGYVPIVHLERVEYHDKVYCLQLEHSGTHFAQGIVVGDYDTGIDAQPESPDPEPIGPELRAQLEEWSEMMDKQYKEWASE